MHKLKQANHFLVLMLFGLFLFSCQKESLDDAISPLQSENDISVQLATTVAKNFAFEQTISQQSSKSKLVKSIARS